MLSRTVMYIILNLAFGVGMILYVTNSLSPAYIQEQTLAKKIALEIDNSYPNMTLSINIEKYLKILDKSVSQKNAISIDNNKKIITVRLKSLKGYSISYFANSNINYEIEQNKFLKVKIQ